MRGRIAIGLLLAGLCCPPAEARSGVTWSYPQDEIYSTAVRFLRIDRGCSITDRDAQAAYLIDRRRRPRPAPRVSCVTAKSSRSRYPFFRDSAPPTTQAGG